MFFASLSSLEVLVQPLSIIWLTCIGGAVFCWRKQQKIGMWILAAIALFMSLIGSGFSKWLLRGLEAPYALESIDHVESADAIVVLGGAHHPSLHDLNGFNLNDSGDRLTTGLDLIKQGKSKTLVLGGSTVKFSDGEKMKSAVLLMDWAERLVPEAEVIDLPITGNTHAEALAVKSLMEEKGWKRIILVTSGYHMKRASGVFSKQDIDHVPVGCGFETRGVKMGPQNRPKWPKTSKMDFSLKVMGFR